MITPVKKPDGIALRAYLYLSQYTEPLFKLSIKRRLKRGKEDPQRYLEKFVITNLKRPTGKLLWLHGVGLGEVLALRGLINSIKAQRKDLSFLVTSSTKTSAAVFSNNCPANTQHQFLPVDCAPVISRFLDHWQPDASIWAEQDLWPALVCHTHKRDIPLIILNARMNDKSYRARALVPGFYRDLYKRFSWISAQDKTTADNMNKLGANATVGGSLKTAAVPLQDNPEQRSAFKQALQGRTCWLLASSHKEDEQLAIAAHRLLLKEVANTLLIIAPRNITRNNDIVEICRAHQLTAAIRSQQQQPHNHQVYIADTFGEMGIWYRLCHAAFIGGSMNNVQGHNPWEAAVLGCPILHGPIIANFQTDYQTLRQHNAAVEADSAKTLLAALQNSLQLNRSAQNARTLVASNNQTVDQLALAVLDTLNKSAAA